MPLSRLTGCSGFRASDSGTVWAFGVVIALSYDPAVRQVTTPPQDEDTGPAEPATLQ